MKSSTWLIYGANGFSGELIAREAVRRRHHPILAGRNAKEISALASELDLEQRIFALDDPAALDRAIADAGVVLHCAGPFSQTARQMVDACLRQRVHYLDITGEIAVFESLARKNRAAADAGVMLLPGCGFDVVPSDCLAVQLKNRLPSATKLTLAWMTTAGISRGTALTGLQNLHRGGAIRQAGKIVRVPAAWKTRQFDFGQGARDAVLIPWGDVSTAFHSTGIPNIQVYVVLPRLLIRLMIVSRYIGWLLGSRVVQRVLAWQIRARPRGPSESERARGKSFLLGRVEDHAGNSRITRISGPEGYTLTTLAALAITERVLAGEYKPGFQTPARAYGADLVLQIHGVMREDI